MKENYVRSCSTGLSGAAALKELTDPELIASWLPILFNVQETVPLQSYTAVLEDKVGPFRLKADLEIEVTIDTERITIRAEGKDRQIGSRLVFGGVLFAEESPDSTRTTMTVEGFYEITGKAAQMGASSIRKKANVLVDGFMDSMAEFLER